MITNQDKKPASMIVDFVGNSGNPQVNELLLNNKFDANVLRPYKGEDGRSYVSLMQDGKLVAVPNINATATLRKDEWKTIDDIVLKAAKPRLKAVADLQGRGLTYNLNGMETSVLQTETQSDISDAEIGMAPHKATKEDRPVFEPSYLPLPFFYKDFSFDIRELNISRRGGSPLGTSTTELASEKVAEGAEKLLLGKWGSFTYGGGSVYGYTNFPSALTKVITDPTAGGWTGATLVGELLAMRSQSQAAYYYGPWIIYTSPNWDAYLDADYSTAKGDNTLRYRIKAIEGFEDCKTLDYLENYEIVMVQTATKVIRLVTGLTIRTIQWETLGGFMVHFKVIAMLVPQLRADQNSRTGVVYAQTA